MYSITITYTALKSTPSEFNDIVKPIKKKKRKIVGELSKQVTKLLDTH